MYDTVNMWQNGFNISGGNPFDILPYLSDVTEYQNKNGYSCSGNVFDYTVNVFERGISLKGSLCKSFFGDNLHTLKRSVIKQAIEKLNDHLHIDLSGAKVTRIDISTVIPTKRPPADYYAYLGNKPYFQREQWKESLYYNNHNRQINFYDKSKEAKFNFMDIPDIWKNSNLFRYELRYLRQINKQLKADVTASTLYDETFYRCVVQNWYDEFKTIQKLKNNSFMIDDITTLKVAKEALFTHLLQQSGQGIIDEFLNELKAKKKFNSRSDYTKLKADLNKMIVAKNGNKNDLIREIETAIFNIAKYAR